MCEHCGVYNYFPSVVIGGPSGDYFVRSPVNSYRWMEYQIVEIANGGVASSLIISGSKAPIKLPYDGTVTLSDQQIVTGHVFNLPSNVSMNGDTQQWDRISNSEGKVYVRIDNDANHASFVTLRFRARVLTVIPGQAQTIHPDLGQQLNIQRAKRIKQHVEKQQASKAGIPVSEWGN